VIEDTTGTAVEGRTHFKAQPVTHFKAQPVTHFKAQTVSLSLLTSSTSLLSGSKHFFNPKDSSYLYSVPSLSSCYGFSTYYQFSDLAIASVNP